MGDYRAYLPDYKRKQEQDFEAWSDGYELWRNDIRGVDLILVQDKLERAIREVYNKQLLVDAGTARLVLVLPSLVPHPVLDSILTGLFERWKYSTISLLPAPTMAVIAAGMRSALVVDIGWEETVVTSVYEYREIHVCRSTRSTKLLVKKMAELLLEIKDEQQAHIKAKLQLDHDFVEEFVARVAHCTLQFMADGDGLAAGVQGIALEQDVSAPSTEISQENINVDWPTLRSSESIEIALARIGDVVSNAMLGAVDEDYFDDHETPLQQLLYKALLALSPDTRTICMSRVIFIGSGSTIPNLQQRILSEVDSLVKNCGWTNIYGKQTSKKHTNLSETTQDKATPADFRHDQPLPVGKDYVEERLRKQKAKEAQPHMFGVLRQVESLGPWAGASLLTSLKVKGFVEIERDRYLSHGLAGASRDAEPSVSAPSANLYGASAPSKGDRTSWTLAGWG